MVCRVGLVDHRISGDTGLAHDVNTPTVNSSLSGVDTNQKMADNRYCVEYAKTGRSGCKKCKTSIEKGCCRIGKITPNPFG